MLEPVYVLGFRELAEYFGRDLVGDPLADEHGESWFRIQPTTRGLLFYADGGHPMFVPGLKVGDQMPGKA